MIDERQLRAGLRAILDDDDDRQAPSPDVRATVFRLGRRRLLYRRAAAVASAVVAVTALSIGVVVLRAELAAQPGHLPTVSHDSQGTLLPGWIDVREPTDVRTAKPPATAQVTPSCARISSTPDFGYPVLTAPPTRDGKAPPSTTPTLTDWLLTAVRQVRPHVLLVSRGPTLVSTSAKTVRISVADGNGTGVVQLSGAYFAGSPTVAADNSLRCHAQRRKLPDGGVLQLYAPRPDDPTTTGQLQAYLSDGRAFVITVTGSGTAAGGTPFTSQQLGALGALLSTTY